jgi:hypothetical protein
MSSFLCRVLLGFAAIAAAFGALCAGAAALLAGFRGFWIDRWPWVDRIDRTASASVFAALFGLALGFSAWEHGQVRRRQRGRCGGCDYDRRGTQPSAPCPECGDAPSMRKNDTPRAIWPIVLIAGLFLARRAMAIFAGESSGVC